MLDGKIVTGIIMECNPFHEGHKRIINAAKKESDIIVVIMSGNFVQRGEPAIYDKYKRTKDLLKNRVDVVIELPVEFAESSAKYFARSGIGILNSLGFVDKLIFGSKINNIEKLKTLASFDIEGNKEIGMLLKSGIPYAKAIEKIYDIRLSANDILGVEYIRAINELKCKIKPQCIKRKSDLPTATSLRKKISARITTNSFTDIINYKILNAKSNNNDFFHIASINNDLNNAILNTANINFSFDKKAMSLNTKNRTLASIKRAFFNILFDIDKNILKESKFGLKPKYIRILGIKKSSLAILKSIKIPFLLSFAPSSYKALLKNFPKNNLIKINKNGEVALPQSIKLNIFASNLYYLLSKQKTNECSNQVVII